MVVIDALLRPYEGVVASSCGHVNTHEAGAIESTGHKVLTVPHKNGKLDADDLREYIETFYADESPSTTWYSPGMVYISHPSEYGTLYTKKSSWSAFPPCAKSLICRSSSTARASATA